jgi:hypothetical protein
VVQASAAKVATASILVSKIDFWLVSCAIESVQECQNDNVNRTILAVRSQTLSGGHWSKWKPEVKHKMW